MPVKPPNGPDYACSACDHLFRQPLWRRLLGLRLPAFARCPKCGGLGTQLIY
ncbi:MAG: hypothetical protein RBU25_18310 [Lentisphaeria bacterium]|jgi:hypothetical protein|nr:hypothetical protein [Lentisphaeria bacterium]